MAVASSSPSAPATAQIALKSFNEQTEYKSPVSVEVATMTVINNLGSDVMIEVF